MKKLQVAVIGVGQRGSEHVRTLLAVENATVVAICDSVAERREAAAARVEEACGTRPATYADYREVLAAPEVDAVIVSTDWDSHVTISIEALRAGKITGMEVGGVRELDECYGLIRAWEETKTPFMFLENCCFGKFELLTTALVRAGKLGDVVHCHGAYSHDLRDEILGGNVRGHYRLPHYVTRNCENYPTHELGPIAKILGLNRGNRMTRLVSVASRAAGLSAFAKTDANPDKSLADTTFKQGDIVSTIITCAGGETITMTLDTTLPKFYSREFTVRGTKGLAMEEGSIVAIEGDCNTHKYRNVVDTAKNYSDYMVPIWRDATEGQQKLGHGGMDYVMMVEFVNAALEGRELPIDVYDAAAWMCVTALSERSIAEGGTPQDIPDFTNGAWKQRPLLDVMELPRP